MKNCIWKGLCLFFILVSLLTTIPAAVAEQNGHGGTTEVVAHIVEPTEPFTEPTQPTEPAVGSGKLRITATRPDPAKAKEQSFVYHVSGPGNTALKVAIVLAAGETSGSVTIAQLPAGEYTVTEDSFWSWRYSSAGSKSTAVGDTTVDISFDHTLEKTEWLSGCSHRYSD